MIKKIETLLDRLLNEKILAVILGCIYVLSIIPLLWIGLYNYPSADDFTLGSKAHVAWDATHNVLCVIGAALERAWEDWLTWMGYFTSNFLMALPPSSFGENWYKLSTPILLGILNFGVFYLFYQIFVKICKASKAAWASICFITLFVSIQCMCAAGRVEAFFWYCGAANYIIVHGLQLIFVGMLISLFVGKGKRQIAKLIIACFLGFLVGGGNQMSALNMAILDVVVIGFLFFLHQKKEYGYLFWPIGWNLLGFVLNCAAPGNLVRSEISHGMNPVKAILVSLYYGLDYVIDQWTKWPVIVCMVMLVPIFWKIFRKVTFHFPCPMLVVLFFFGLVSAMFTPPLFAVGGIEAGRIQGLTYLMYILLLVLSVAYVTGYVQKKLVPHKDTAEDFSIAEKWCLLGCIGLLLVGTGLTVIPDEDYFTYSAAITDLANGEAKAYGNALKERNAYIHKALSEQMEDIVVEPLPVEPTLLYFSDIKHDPADWENQGLSRYYGTEAKIYVKEKQLNEK